MKDDDYDDDELDVDQPPRTIKPASFTSAEIKLVKARKSSALASASFRASPSHLFIKISNDGSSTSEIRKPSCIAFFLQDFLRQYKLFVHALSFLDSVQVQ